MVFFLCKKADTGAAPKIKTQTRGGDIREQKSSEGGNTENTENEWDSQGGEGGGREEREERGRRGGGPNQRDLKVPVVVKVKLRERGPPAVPEKCGD